MKQALDNFTGRVTMYRLVTLALSIVAAASVGFSLFQLTTDPPANPPLPFTPTELLANLAVALGATILSSRMFALLLRTRPHTESSIITGLILFFLFWPSLDPRDLTTLALAGVLATASKYFIAWRGRHILNPAAAGATLVALLQFGGSVWWVATGALLPFVLIGAFLILYRTGRLAMGAVFALVALAILTVRLTSGGQDVGDAFITSVTSYPVLFFAGFMLSEPLTMAPRRWQQLAIAALVGALFTVPFTFGPIYLSFELALVIGNVIAFVAGQRRGIRLTYLGSRQVTPTAWEFRFSPKRPLRFRPGQWLEFTLPHTAQDSRGTRRIFSIASAPGNDVAVALRMPERTSSFKRSLLELEPGAALRATSVGGDFLLPRDTSTPVLLIAGGIGITPFLSQLVDDRASGIDRDVVLVYEVTSLDELAFVEELALERVLLIAPDAPPHLPDAWRWIGVGPITPELLEQQVQDVRQRRAFVSGSPLRVNRARAALRQVGVRKIAVDAFSGY